MANIQQVMPRGENKYPEFMIHNRKIMTCNKMKPIASFFKLIPPDLRLMSGWKLTCLNLNRTLSLHLLQHRHNQKADDH